ncbi:pirin family protein [Alteromonas facilis]|uniref:pirin family protein n=1 Tax=Alteromonas facilis TaxID=2048004 RepID=UPI000C281B3F|nr:pirin family protein [Alteromonas facilis]
MIHIRSSESRGRANFGWLESRHTFSFGQYYDPNHMGVSALRVINDDLVSPGAGFATHGHSHMEIISLVTDGEMVHKDSEGHEQVLPAGEFQLMSAGDGITHSEYNASKQDLLSFLQIWIVPSERGGKPGYQQKRFDLSKPITPIVTPDGREGTLKIKQDAELNHLNLASDEALHVSLDPQRNYFFHVMEGEMQIDGEVLQPGDGAHITQQETLTLQKQGDSAVKALFFDLP